MQTITTIGLDIAMSVFQVHGVDAGGQVIVRRQLKRRSVLAFFQKLPPCLVGISLRVGAPLVALAHEIGHTPTARCLGDYVHAVTIVPDQHRYEGRCVRSGPVTELTLKENMESKTADIVEICARLERLAPELGTPRIESSEYISRCHDNIIELVAAEEAEFIFHPDLPSLRAQHDFVEANAFAKVAVAAQPAVSALLAYCKAEARALIEANRDIAEALIEALIGQGTLTGEQVDTVISHEIAMRSLRLEHQRRADWKQRERNAAQFRSDWKDGPGQRATMSEIGR